MLDTIVDNILEYITYDRLFIDKLFIGFEILLFVSFCTYYLVQNQTLRTLAYAAILFGQTFAMISALFIISNKSIAWQYALLIMVINGISQFLTLRAVDNYD